MLQTREEFIQWVETNFHGVSAKPDSPLWIPEHDLESTLCGWFVTVRQLHDADGYTQQLKSEYWAWCRDNLNGHTRCFWSSNEDNKECWGFTNYNDIDWWMLKWAR